MVSLLCGKERVLYEKVTAEAKKLKKTSIKAFFRVGQAKKPQKIGKNGQKNARFFEKTAKVGQKNEKKLTFLPSRHPL
jgi:hypothetical protein